MVPFWFDDDVYRMKISLIDDASE